MNLRRRITAIFTCFCMLATMIPAGYASAEGESIGYNFNAVRTTDNLKAISGNTNSILVADIEINATIDIKADTVLDLNGHTITATSNNPVFNIASGKTLTIKNSGNTTVYSEGTDAAKADTAEYTAPSYTALAAPTACSASIDGNQNEQVEKLFDNNSGTKYCCKGTSAAAGIVTITFNYDAPKTVARYSFTSGNDTGDYPQRIPKSWVLYGSNNPTDENSWKTIDTASEPKMAKESQKLYTYNISKGADGSFTAYQYYKVDFTLPANDSIFQMADMNLYEETTTGGLVIGDKDGNLSRIAASGMIVGSQAFSGKGNVVLEDNVYGLSNNKQRLFGTLIDKSGTDPVDFKAGLMTVENGIVKFLESDAIYDDFMNDPLYLNSNFTVAEGLEGTAYALACKAGDHALITPKYMTSGTNNNDITGMCLNGYATASDFYNYNYVIGDYLRCIEFEKSATGQPGHYYVKLVKDDNVVKYLKFNIQKKHLELSIEPVETLVLKDKNGLILMRQMGSDGTFYSLDNDEGKNKFDGWQTDSYSDNQLFKAISNNNAPALLSGMTGALINLKGFAVTPTDQSGTLKNDSNTTDNLKSYNDGILYRESLRYWTFTKVNDGTDGAYYITDPSGKYLKFQTAGKAGTVDEKVVTYVANVTNDGRAASLNLVQEVVADDGTLTINTLNQNGGFNINYHFGAWQNNSSSFRSDQSQFKLVTEAGGNTTIEYGAAVAGTVYHIYPGMRIGFSNSNNFDGYNAGDMNKYLKYTAEDSVVKWFSIADSVDTSKLPVMIKAKVTSVPEGGKVGYVYFWITGDKNDTYESLSSEPYRMLSCDVGYGGSSSSDYNYWNMTDRVIYMIPGDTISYPRGIDFYYNNVKLTGENVLKEIGNDLTWLCETNWNNITAKEGLKAEANSTDGLISDTTMKFHGRYVHILIYDTREHANAAEEKALHDAPIGKNVEITVKPGYRWYCYGNDASWYKSRNSGSLLSSGASVANRTNTDQGWYWWWGDSNFKGKESYQDEFNSFTVLPGYDDNRSFTIFNDKGGSVTFKVEPADMKCTYEFKTTQGTSLEEMLDELGVRDNPLIGDAEITNVFSTDTSYTYQTITHTGTDYNITLSELYSDPITICVNFANGAAVEISTTAEDKGVLWDYKATADESGITIVQGNFKNLIDLANKLPSWNVVSADDPSHSNHPVGYEYVVTSRTKDSTAGSVIYNGKTYYFYAAGKDSGYFRDVMGSNSTLPCLQGNGKKIICWIENEDHEVVYLPTVCIGNTASSDTWYWKFGGTGDKVIYTNAGLPKEDGSGNNYNNLSFDKNGKGTKIAQEDSNKNRFQGIRPQSDGYYIMSCTDDACDEFSVFQCTSLINVTKNVECDDPDFKAKEDFEFIITYTDHNNVLHENEHFTLRDGESEAFIPIMGTSVTVTEAPADGYSTSYTVNGGESQVGNTASVLDVDMDTGADFQFTNKKGSAPYTIEYYYDNALDEDATINGRGYLGKEIKKYPDKSKEGYALAKVTNFPLTVSSDEDSNVIKVYYKSENSKITVTKTFKGLNQAQIDKLDEDGFFIEVSDKILDESYKLSLTEKAGCYAPVKTSSNAGGITYTWSIPAAWGGTFDVEESNASIKGYALTTKVNDKDASETESGTMKVEDIDTGASGESQTIESQTEGTLAGDAGVEITDDIKNSGNLVASVTGIDMPAGYHFEWYSSLDGTKWTRIGKTKYTSGASNISGEYCEKINVALTGGARTETTMTTYRAVLTADNKVPSAEIGPKSDFVQSRYYDRIMNGGFENEEIPNNACCNINRLSPFVSSDLSDSDIKKNFYDLYENYDYNRKESSVIWKTTIPSGVIEIISASKDKIANDTYHNATYETLALGSFFANKVAPEHSDTNKVTYEGDQMAELNADQVGSLYQDIITVPGTELYWSFMHRARVYGDKTDNDSMRVLIMRASMAEDLMTTYTDPQAAVNYVLNNLDEFPGAQVSDVLTADADKWTKHSGTYKVPEGQALTRLFFVSASTYPDLGNLIDDVTLSTDKLTPEKTKATLVINKKIKGNLTTEERQTLIENLEVDYSYVDDQGQTVEGTIGNGEGETPFTWGANDEGTFALTLDIPEDKSVEFTVSEDLEKAEVAKHCHRVTYTADLSCGGHDAGLSDGDENIYSVTMQGGEVATVTITNEYSGSIDIDNEYELSTCDLTVIKNVVGDMDDNDQRFIFHVVGTEDTATEDIDMYVAAMKAEGEQSYSVTICNLPAGEYTVTEDTDWSWRYEPDQTSKEKVISPAQEDNSVTFNNTLKNRYWLSGTSYAVNNKAGRIDELLGAQWR